MTCRPLSREYVAYAVLCGLFFSSSLAGGQTRSGVDETDRVPDLRGVWNFSTATPMQRPEDLADRVLLSPEETAQYEREIADRRRAGDSTSDSASLEARVSYDRPFGSNAGIASPRVEPHWLLIHLMDEYRRSLRTPSNGQRCVESPGADTRGVPKTEESPSGVKWTPIFGPAAKVVFEPAPTADGGADTMKKTRTKHSPAFKAKVALAALRDQESVAEIARRYKVHANVVYKWKRQLLDNAAQSFETDHSDGGASDREDVLLKKIGELTVERDFLSNGLGRSR